MSEEFNHFLGLGIILKDTGLKQSPYRREVLKEKFFKNNILIELENGDFFLGTLLDREDDEFLDKMRKAEKDLPQLYQEVFKEELPKNSKVHMVSKQGYVWR
jgi:hypothetical protein